MVVAAALLLATPLAAAGSLDDPEIVDPAGDHFTGQEVDPVQALDVLAVYLTEEQGLCDDATEVTMVMQFNNIITGNSGAPGAWFSSSIYFTINENEYRTYLRPAPNLGPITEPWIYMYDITADSDRMVIDGGVDNSEDEKAWWCVPYENLNDAQPGDVVTNLWGRTYIDQYGPADLAPDGAPDSGEFGREYVLGGVVPVEGNLTVESPQNGTEVVVQLGASATFSISVTNHASDNDTVVFSVANVSEGWEATVDPANVTVEPNGTAFANVTAAPLADNATTGTVTVSYNSTLGLSGNLTFAASVAPPPATMPGVGDGNETGNGTAQDADDGLGIPNVGPVALLAVACIVAEVYRRRR